LSSSPTGPGPGNSDFVIDQLVPHLDLLKCQPDFESSAELNSWKYQRFYQILVDFCNINYNSMSGQMNMSSLFYSQVLELFKWPLQQCPDLVTLGLLGCNNGPSVVKNELLSLAIPAFLGNHPNAAIILHTLWNSNELSPNVNPNNNWAKQILLQGMCEYYIKSPAEEQQQRLSRILDVAQDLKALSILLNGNCHPFVIDLACLASRREYLKLDKWLMDKIESNGESFVNACIVFLNRRCSALLGGSNAIESSANSNSMPNLSSETLATMLACLQQSISQTNPPSNGVLNGTPMSQEISETILTMVGNSTRLLAKLPRQAGVTPTIGPPPTARPSLVIPPQSSLSDLGISNLTISQTPDSQTSTFPAAVRPPFNPLGLGSQQNANNVSTNSVNVVPQAPERLRQVVGDLAAIFPDMQQNVSIDIEEEADTYFQRIYNHQQTGSLSIDEVLDMLRRFQDSQSKREREVFTCMIRNLFKEYGFFPQYPDRELLITAQLFGGIIQMGLVKYMALVVALRYVLEALRKPLGSKMYYFGIAALDRFKPKLKDYPLYCQHLAQIPHFRDFPQHLIEYIECGTQSAEPSLRNNLSSSQQIPVGLPSIVGSSANSGLSTALPQLSQMINSTPNINNVIGSGLSLSNQNNTPSSRAVQPPIAPSVNSTATIATTSTTTTAITTSSTTGLSSTTNSRPSIANATNIDTLLAAGDTIYTVPPDSVQDKIAFIINNLSQINLAHKTEEFKEAIGNEEQYNGWIAQYFVMKRSSIEPNFHALYANFIEMLKMNELTKIVLKETHRNIKVLLRSDKEIANFSDRSLLKNLGHWLGMLTLAKSKPILSIDLDLKSLLIEAYHRGTQELLYVVPFIAKILESCAKSKVFKPPNPWTMGIIRALVELHQEPNLKLNLKFEVEVLCKTLNLDINASIGKSNVLKNEEIFSKIEPQLGGGKASQPMPASHDHIVIPHHTPSPAPQLVPSHPPIPSVAQTNVTTPTAGTQSPGMQLFNYHDINVSAISGLSQHILIQPNLPLLNNNPMLKQYIRPAIERAVQEWIIPVVERSMKISLTTAEQIIKKDFALDPDENRMCLAAHYLTRNLTAGMAMITCKDPLFVSITTALKNAFVSKCQTSNKDLIDATAHQIATDNIDLACCFIQKTAIEKSLPELDRKLKSEYDIRRAARAEGRRYCDPTVLTYQAERMPEAIRLKVGPVTSQQMNVYEELGKNIPGFLSPISDSIQTATTTSNPTIIGQMLGSTATSMAQFKSSGGMSSLGSLSNTTNSSNMSGISNLPTNFGGVSELPPVPPQAADAALVTIYEKLMTELETLLHQFHNAMQPQIFLETIRSIGETLVLARQNPRDIVYALTLIQKVLDAIGELLMSVESGVADVMLVHRARDLYLVILKALSDPRAFTHQWTTKQITRIVLERLLNNSSPPSLPDELLETLMRASLINFQMMDVHLAQMVENAQNPVALAFTLQFIKIYGHNCNETDFPNTIENLLRMSKGANHPLFAEIQQIVDVLRNSQTGPMNVNNEVPSNMLSMHGSINQTREFDADPPGLLEKTERLLREWIQLYHSQANTSKIFQFYVQQMNLQVLNKLKDYISLELHSITII
jgi:CCR4-NOT transcription complex subunit 1